MEEILYYIIEYGLIAIYFILTFILIRWIINGLFKHYHSNWNILIDGFDYSSYEFYERLKTELKKHGIANITIGKVNLKEGGFWSRSRIYLRATWRDYQYDICAAPFGNGFFISWWLLYKNSIGKILVSKIPFVGVYLARVWFPVTYYKRDTASMFMTYAQDSVLRVINEITKGKGVRALTEDERKPILNNAFKR